MKEEKVGKTNKKKKKKEYNLTKLSKHTGQKLVLNEQKRNGNQMRIENISVVVFELLEFV